MSIPKIIHQIWIGENPIPPEYIKFIKSFNDLYKDYAVLLWNDEKIKSNIIIPENLKKYYYDNTLHVALKCDILRYLIIYKYGGLYFDVDFEPLKKLPDSFLDFNFLGAIQNNGEVAIGFFGSNPNNIILELVIDGLEKNIELNKNKGYYLSQYIHKLTGPEYFNRKVSDFKSHDSSSFFFTSEYFYPYWMNEEYRRNENFRLSSPLAYAVHHWYLSWNS